MASARRKETAPDSISTSKVRTMATQIIQHWTHSRVPLEPGIDRAVVYKVVREGTRLYQEIRDVESNLIQTLELPPGAPLDKRCFEVLLRYVLIGQAAAGA